MNFWLKYGFLPQCGIWIFKRILAINIVRQIKRKCNKPDKRACLPDHQKIIHTCKMSARRFYELSIRVTLDWETPDISHKATHRKVPEGLLGCHLLSFCRYRVFRQKEYTFGDSILGQLASYCSGQHADRRAYSSRFRRAQKVFCAIFWGELWLIF